MGIDEDSTPTHSMVAVPGKPEKKSSNLQGDWMIRAYVTKAPKGQAKTLLGATARDANEIIAEAAQDAKILGAARSLTLKHDTGKMDD